MKFLVLWSLNIPFLSREMLRAVGEMQGHAGPLVEAGKIVSRFHVIGGHGGAWIYNVASNEELELLLAMMPVYNFASFSVYPLADSCSLNRMKRSESGAYSEAAV